MCADPRGQTCRSQAAVPLAPNPALPRRISRRPAALRTWYARWINSDASFLREWWRSPRDVGAICPSSVRLAGRMVQWVQPAPTRWVVELGGGTGTVTAALLRCGVPPNRLIVIERSLRFVRHLRNLFPCVRIVHGDAADAAAATGALPVNTIVSGLPLRSLPAAAVHRITETCARLLPADRRLIQFTYAPHARSPWLAANLELIASETVWLNLPPARVEVFRSGIGVASLA